MPNPTTNLEGKDVLNTQVVRDYLCDSCYGELVEVYEPDPPKGEKHWIVQCASHPEHRGLLKRMTAHIRQRKEMHRGKG